MQSNLKKIVSLITPLIIFVLLFISPELKDLIQELQYTQVLGTVDEQGFEQALVIRVIDGDTIELSDGRKLRYIGIDTPETKHPSKDVECFGQEASKFNQELVEGKIVSLEKDISETDKYGRLLRYVYLPSSHEASEGQGQVMVNQKLVAQGYAAASSYPPDIKYQEKFLEAERLARENNLGLWGTCEIKY